MQDRILETGTKLFFRYGVKTVTMDDIASELGISKKTIYQHYPDKNTLVKEVVSNFINQDIEKFKLAESNFPDILERMVAYFDSMKVFIKDLNPRLLYEIEKYHPEAFTIFRTYKENFLFQKLVGDLRAGIESGIFRPDIPVNEMAKMRLAEAQLIFNPEFLDQSSLSWIELNEVFQEYFIRGISTEKGLIRYKELTLKNK